MAPDVEDQVHSQLEGPKPLHVVAQLYTVVIRGGKHSLDPPRVHPPSFRARAMGSPSRALHALDVVPFRWTGKAT